MTGPTLIIRSLTRELRGTSSEETLEFTPGVNVIVGPHNSGKTKWLTMFDYLLGDRDLPEQALGDLATKYVGVKAECQIGGDAVVLERRWAEPGSHTRVIVDGKAHNFAEFYAFLMDRLHIPIVHYPSGDPLGPRAWPELNFRSLLRHIYRQQKYWSDIADRQPYPEQHASLLQFLGLAEFVFSQSYSDLASAQKEIAELQVRKEQYLQILDDVSRPLLEDEALGGILTEERIAAASAAINQKIEELTAQRSALLEDLRTKRPVKDAAVNAESLGRNLVDFSSQLAQVQAQSRRTDERLQEMRAYRESLESEKGRLERAMAGGLELASLRVTHCPACDRPLPEETAQSDVCYVCKRPTEDEPSGELAVERVTLEQQRLQSEIAEADELIETLSAETVTATAEAGRIRREIERLNSLLAPARSASAAIMPPEISITDMRIGELRQRRRQLDGLRVALDKRLSLSKQIDEIHGRIKALEARVDEQTARSDFDQSGDQLAEGMNDYLEAIRRANLRSWTSGRVTLRADPRTFQFFVDAKRWSAKLGATLSLYFLIAYHYGLLRLTDRDACHYPGLLVLDLPAEIEDSESIADRENFILLPFIAATENRDDLQVIVAGSSFEGLTNITRIPLTTVWR